MQTLLAWHFVGKKLRDGRPVPPDGETLHYDGPLVLCHSGLHASERLIDALYYARGEKLCRVRCGGEIVHDTDKLICRERTIIWRIDASALLCEFARRCALDVTHLWDAPAVVLEYLRTGDETKRIAARDDAARVARNSVSITGAKDAALAAWAAATNAAFNTPKAAAWTAAAAADGAVVTAAANSGVTCVDTTWNNENKLLTEMVERAKETSPCK